MPEPPNKPLEEQLKDWAQKRREEAGAPFELHPATRRLLQDEVGRTYPTRSDEPGAHPGSWSRLFWPRFALVGSLGVALIIMAAILLPGLTKSKSKTQQLALVRDQEKPLTPETARSDGMDTGGVRGRAEGDESARTALPDVAANAPTAESRPAPGTPALAEAKLSQREVPLPAESKDAGQKALEPAVKLETEKGAERIRQLELAYSEKLKEPAPAQPGPGTVDRRLTPEYGSNRFMMQ